MIFFLAYVHQSKLLALSSKINLAICETISVTSKVEVVGYSAILLDSSDLIVKAEFSLFES
jgi:hypothetical protein